MYPHLGILKCINASPCLLHLLKSHDGLWLPKTDWAQTAWAQLTQNAPEHNWHFAQPWLSNIEADEWIGQRREVDQAIVYEQGKTCVITLVLSCASLCCQAWTQQIPSVLAVTLHALPYFQVTWVKIRNKHRVRRQHSTLPRIMKNLLPSTTTAFC